MTKKCIILGNGDKPPKRLISYLQKHGFNMLIAADGGADSARLLNLTPDIIIGDFDSVKPNTLALFSEASRIIKRRSQNNTDIEKAVDYAADKGILEVMLLGAFGSRVDHSLGNIANLMKYYGKLRCRLISGDSLVEAISGSHKLISKKGETISLYGIDASALFTTSGLKYPLHSEPLPFGVRESTSNVAAAQSVTVTVDGGTAILVRDLKFLAEHDLFQYS